MSARAQNLGIVAFLVVTLALVAWALRSPSSTDTTAAGSSASSAPSTGDGSGSAPSSGSPSSGSASSRSPSPSSSGGTAVFIGDSFAAGKGASTPAKRWSTLVSGAKGWTEVNLAHARTGYAKQGAPRSCGTKRCPAYVDLVAQVAAAKPDVVVISGGANDLTVPAATRDGVARSTVVALRAKLPQAKILVVNPWWDLRPADPQLAAYRTVLKSATTAARATWLDTRQPLAGHRELMTADGFQANDAGHAALAAAVEKALARAE